MRYAPLKMRPRYQGYLWGGRRLKHDFGKTDAPEMTAESWELSSHLDGCSSVAEGPLLGKTRVDLAVLDRAGFWGTACLDGTFPVLVKLIDAEGNLSVQVHPSDQAALSECGEQGKAEMWYIVDCNPQLSIFYGFSQKVTKTEYLLIELFASSGLYAQELPEVTVEAVQTGKIVCDQNKYKQIVTVPVCLQKELLSYAEKNGILSRSIFRSKDGRPMHRTYVSTVIRNLCEKAQAPSEKGNPKSLWKLYCSTRLGIESNIALLVEQAMERMMEQEQFSIGWEDI